MALSFKPSTYREAALSRFETDDLFARDSAAQYAARNVGRDVALDLLSRTGWRHDPNAMHILDRLRLADAELTRAPHAAPPEIRSAGYYGGPVFGRNNFAVTGSLYEGGYVRKAAGVGNG